MESEVRQRKQPTTLNGSESSGSADQQRQPGSSSSAAKVDRHFSRLLAIAAAAILATYLLLTLCPDSTLRLNQTFGLFFLQNFIQNCLLMYKKFSILSAFPRCEPIERYRHR
jgi:hypothetical protein